MKTSFVYIKQFEYQVISVMTSCFSTDARNNISHSTFSSTAWLCHSIMEANVPSLTLRLALLTCFWPAKEIMQQKCHPARSEGTCSYCVLETWLLGCFFREPNFHGCERIKTHEASTRIGEDAPVDIPSYTSSQWPPSTLVSQPGQIQMGETQEWTIQMSHVNSQNH